MRSAVVLTVLCLALPSTAEEKAKTYDLSRRYNRLGETWTVQWELRSAHADGSKLALTGVARVACWLDRERPRSLHVHIVREDMDPLFREASYSLTLRDDGSFTVRDAAGVFPHPALVDTLTRSMAPGRPVARLGKWEIDGAFGLMDMSKLEQLRFRLEDVKTNKHGTFAVVSVRCRAGVEGGGELTGVMLVDLATGIRHSLRLEGESGGSKVYYILKERKRGVTPQHEEQADAAEPDAATPAPTRFHSSKGDFSLDVPQGWRAKEIGAGMGVRLTQDATKATFEVHSQRVKKETTAKRYFDTVLLRRLKAMGAKIASHRSEVIGGDIGYGARYSSGHKTGWLAIITDNWEQAWKLHARMPTNAAEAVMPEVRAITASLRLPGPH